MDIKDNYIFYWETEHYHQDNMFTMNEFLEEYLPEEADILLEDGTYGEIAFEGKKYAIYASGNGDSFNHLIKFELLN